MWYIVILILMLVVLWHLHKRALRLTYYYLDGCPHCVEFDQVWGSLRNYCSLKYPYIQFSKTNLLDTRGIPHAPYLRLFGPLGKYTDYTGPRNLQSVMTFVESHT